MGFLRPKAPKQQEPPPPPAIEDTDAKDQDYQDALRRRRGRAASVLTQRDQAAPVTASKALLGG